MKTKSISIIFIVIIVLAAVVVAGTFYITYRNKDEDDVQEQNEEQNEEQNVIQEGYVLIKEDGTKENISDKLKETKTFDGLTYSNITLTKENGMTYILADVYNGTEETVGEFPVGIELLDEEGNTIRTVNGYINQIEPGGTVKLNAGTTIDAVQAYDIRIVKQ